MKRRRRSIDLDGPEPVKSSPTEKGVFERVIRTRHCVTKIRRVGTKLTTTTQTVSHLKPGKVERTVTRTTESAVIHYKEILAATEIVEDTHRTEAPWEDGDGWEHSVQTSVEWEEALYEKFEGYGDTDEENDARFLAIAAKHGPGNAWFVAYHNCVFAQMVHNGHIHIILDPQLFGELAESTYAYARAKGASKQVAAEMRACAIRQNVSQLAEW